MSSFSFSTSYYWLFSFSCGYSSLISFFLILPLKYATTKESLSSSKESYHILRRKKKVIQLYKDIPLLFQKYFHLDKKSYTETNVNSLKLRKWNPFAAPRLMQTWVADKCTMEQISNLKVFPLDFPEVFITFLSDWISTFIQLLIPSFNQDKLNQFPWDRYLQPLKPIPLPSEWSKSNEKFFKGKSWDSSNENIKCLHRNNAYKSVQFALAR